MNTIELTYQDIDNAWKDDAPIRMDRYEEEAAKVPKLHSKYLSYYVGVTSALRKLERVYLEMRRIKTRYYLGELTKEELTEYKWAQYQKPKPLKTEMEGLIDTDSDILDCVEELERLRLMRDQLERIIKSIASRGYDIKNAIEFHKFTQGG